MIIRLRDRSESDRERHPTRRQTPLLTFLYYSRRRRHTTRNAHGGSGGDDGSGTFALSQPATTVRKVIRGFSRRRAPGFYTAAATCIPLPQSVFRHPPTVCGAPPPPLTSWRKIGAISTQAHRGNARARGGHSLGSVAPSPHPAALHTRCVLLPPPVLFPSTATIILLLYYVCGRDSGGDLTRPPIPPEYYGGTLCRDRIGSDALGGHRYCTVIVKRRHYRAYSNITPPILTAILTCYNKAAGCRGSSCQCIGRLSTYYSIWASQETNHVTERVQKPASFILLTHHLEPLECVATHLECFFCHHPRTPPILIRKQFSSVVV
ncbi:hypothetical protein QTP88_015130 [Uroleucon formosanum]